MARPFLTDPDLPNKIKAGVPFNKCLGCSRGCNERIYKPLDATCVLNPEVGKEYLDIKYDRVEQNKGKKMLVVGGGPSGLYAAVKASKRGYTVTLATKESRLGGELYLAAIPPRKHDLFYFIKNKEYELKQAGVEVLLNTEVDAAFIEKFQPDYVAVAVGGRPFYPPVPGLDRENVYLPAQVLEPTPELLDKLKRGKTVVIGGGSVGLETAIFLSEKSMGSEEAVEFYFNHVQPLGLAPVLEFQDITIVEMMKKVGADLGSLRRFSVPDAKRLNIKMLTETKVLEVKDDVVVVEDPEGKKELPYDNIILAAGLRSLEPDFIKTLDEKGIPYGKVGDALKPGSAMNATQTAFEWSLTI
jgi:2,4-dienoyl-CoA reductase (NADPH2)